MLDTHNKIIKEVVEERKKDPKVVAIMLFGSLARGAGHEKSDVDIEIVYDGGEYSDVSEHRYGVKVDFETWPKQKLAARIENYPFLSYPYLEEKILYDPKGFAKEIIAKLKKYYSENPDALKLWKEWTKGYLKAKKEGLQRTDEEKAQACKEFYDEIEIKFSKEHRVTRDW
jgi:predicted nucleotidyltransferase